MLRNLIIVIMLLSGLSESFAWGVTGHRATGKIADEYLTKRARKALNKILKGESLAMASTWMDEIRSDSTYDYMVDWHWVTIQDGETYEKSLKNPKGDVIEAIDRVVAKLKSHTLSPKEEIEYIKILIHLVGDIHQPLHVGGGTDRGGNDVKVNWFRTESNLHRVWDSDMIDDTRLSYTEFAGSLPRPSREEAKRWQQAGVREWAMESITYRPMVYAIGNGRLGFNYSYNYFPIVRTRVMQAGVRLAGILNTIYG